ncbi:MAG: glycoside hydrolase family 44 protein [Polyangia bacterium]
MLASYLAVGILLGCSGTNNSISPTSTGGASLNGGNSSTGGVSSGMGGVGGATSAVSIGGLSSGGNASGGTATTGGRSATGGAMATGGKSSSSTSNVGGASATSGTTSTAGSLNTGGTFSVGGTQSSGGVEATGGVPATGGTSANSSTVAPTCQANCTGKTCGPDGCNGTCGGCPPSQLCSASQTCVASTSTTSIVVDAKSQGTPISSGIYGVAFNNDDSMQLAGVNRWGGDATSSYNWQIDVSNAGSDWNCANYKGRFTPPTTDASYTNSSDQFVHYNIQQKVDTLMTIPITGWVASMATPNPGTPNCAGSSAISTCCTTLGTSEEKLVDKGSSVLDTSFMQSWVQHLVSTFGNAANGGVRYYQLDNEPDNWQNLRTDIYSTFYPPGTVCEPFYTTNSSIGVSLNQDFINRTMAYAKAIKAADSTASVLFMSTENAQDLVAIPNVECGNPTGPYTVDNSLTKAILTQAATADATSTQRTLDCVDMHYPFPGKGLGDTKALWDTTGNTVPPHIQGWISAAYPGTGICVSEYNVPSDGTNGSTPDPTSGTQEADNLGMFGRLGYRLAAYWTTLVSGKTHLPVYNAMAMYRNYDGQGGKFGAYSIGAASPNSGVNVYASSDSATSPTKVWVMLVNVSGATQTGLTITINNFTPTGSAQVYRMANAAAPAADTAATITNGSISGFSLPSNSVALLAMSH